MAHIVLSSVLLWWAASVQAASSQRSLNAQRIRTSLDATAAISAEAQGAQHIQDADKPAAPKWPDSYTVSFELSMPYLYFSQPEGLKFPVTVWVDKGAEAVRTEIMKGLDTVIVTPMDEYTIYPRINETRCGVFEHGPNSLRAHKTGVGFLPDLSEWDYGGSITMGDKPVQMWRTEIREGTKISQYTFYVTPEGVPVKFLMAGVQWFTGGHFDEYYYDFTSFTPGIVWPAQDTAAAAPTGECGVRGASPFEPPCICDTSDVRSRVERLTRSHPIALQAAALTPRVRQLTHEDLYHVYAYAAHDSQRVSGPGSRAHTRHDEYDRRLGNFQRVVNMIHTHNTDASQRYKMRLNRWADWDEREWLDLMLPNEARKAALEAQGVVIKHKPLYVYRGSSSADSDGVLGAGKANKPLPREVDWRGTGADSGVKDQGMCGSCFAFAATATMEGTWYVSTGQRRSFSEQQLLDCSWDYPACNGCGGGDYQPLIQYVSDNGGIALEQEYPYLSNSDFCRASNVTRVGQFKGWVEVEQRNERALMEAVATHGPIAVAVDAKWESFRYYAEGVYSEPKCRTESTKLDHAVVLAGYGTTDDGEDYWLVKNTWSKFYGDDGHIKIKRGKHDCGISSDPAFSVVSDSSIVPGVAELKRLEAVKKW